MPFHLAERAMQQDDGCADQEGRKRQLSQIPVTLDPRPKSGRPSRA
jgi:hypothetical protein